jgi:anti-sigma28 factor (negative regulator of flagellin synthesis)
MNTFKQALPFVLSLALLAGIVLAAPLFTETAMGSISQDQEYNATTTTAAETRVLKTTYQTSGTCGFGSIVVASSSATSYTIKNATSTTDIASSTIVTLKAGIAEGTYTFDATCSRGLIIEAPAGFSGFYVATWR